MLLLIQVMSCSLSAKEPYKIAFACATLGNPYFIAVKEGIEKRCKEIGAEAIIVDAMYDVAKQVSDVENLMLQGVDAMIIAPIDENALHELVELAKQRGIVVLAEAQGIKNANGIYIVNEYEYGKIIGGNAAKWINEKLGGKAECVIISQDNVEPVIKRGDGIRDAIMNACPEAKIVARQAGDTPEQGMKIVENILQAYPNVKVVVGNNDSGALGGYEAVVAMKKNTEDMFVGGGDAVAEALSKMKEPGSVYRATVDLNPVETGEECVDIAVDYIQNGTPDEPKYFYLKMNPIWQDEL